MSYENWKDKIGTFEVMDVRDKKMDFFPALKAKAAALNNGEGLHIIQTFEPVPLYPVLALTEQRILKTGDQASVANGKLQGLTLSGRIEYLSVGKSPCIVHANGIAVFDCHERLLNVV